MRELKIACATHRKALKWKNTTTAWPDLRDRLCATVYTAETQGEYWAMGKDERDAAKDKGCFVGGYLNKGRRKTENVSCRSLITLDGDELAPDFIDGFQDRCRFAAVLYTTHSHMPEAPRARIVIPLAEDIPPDRYAPFPGFSPPNLASTSLIRVPSRSTS